MKENVRRFDGIVGAWVSRLPSWLKPVMELFTLIGQPPFTVGVCAVVLGYGLALNKPYYIISGAIAIGTIAIVALLKVFLRRRRPVTDYVANMLFKSFSFPSGHAAGALVSYGLTALVISLKWPELTIAAWATALVATFMISLSRIYLGAHFPSDIIGGWLVGGAGLLAILLVELP